MSEYSIKSAARKVGTTLKGLDPLPQVHPAIKASGVLGLSQLACQALAGGNIPTETQAQIPTPTGTLAVVNPLQGFQDGLIPGGNSAITETPTASPTATATPDVSPTPLVNPGVTPGVVGSPSAVPTETATPVPTETATPSAVYPILETGGVSPGFDVDGVPSVVYIPTDADHVPNNGPDRDGNDHISKLGQYTGIASPGAYYYDGNLAAAQEENPNIARDIISGVCSVQGSDTRINFGAQNVSAPVNEGTFREVETAGGNWIIHTPNGEINLTLDPKENHAWMIVVKAPTQDGNTPADNNIFLELNGKDPFSNSTMTGKGSFMSQEMVDQIARAMHTAEGSANSSGADGSKEVSMIYVDSATGSWSVFETQFNAVGHVTGYKLVATNSVIQ